MNPNSPTLRDLPYDLAGEVLSKLSPRTAMTLITSDADLYRHYKQSLSKLRKYYKNVPLPDQVDDFLDKLIDEATVTVSIHMVSNDDMMDDLFISPGLLVSWNSMVFSIRFYEEDPTDSRLLEMNVVRQGDTVVPFATVTIYKTDDPVAYRIFIQGGIEAKIDRDVLTASTMMIHRLKELLQKTTVPSHKRLVNRVVNNAIARIEAVYSKDLLVLQVQPPAFTQQPMYPLAENIRRRRTPMKDW